MTIRYWSSEQTVNTTVVNSQSAPSVAVLTDGSYVIAWTDDNGAGDSLVRFQRFDVLGNRLGIEQTLPVSDGSGDQTNPQVAALADGGFLIGVLDDDGAPLARDVVAYRYTAGGTPVETILIQDGFNDTASLFIDGGAAGSSFVAAFDVNGSAIYRNPGGTSVPASIFLKLHGLDYESQPGSSVSAIAGSYLTFISGVPTLAIGVAIYNETTSTPASLIFLGVDDGTGSASVRWVDQGRLVAVWTELTASKAALYDSQTGQALSPILSLPAGSTAHEVTVLSDKRIVIVYKTVGNDIMLTLMDEWGNRLASDFLVEQNRGGFGSLPDIAALADGRIVVTWASSDPGADGAGSAILSQVIDPRDGVIDGRNDPFAPDLLYGHNTVSDFIRGFAGNDKIFGLGGSDLVYAGEGADTVNGGKGDDELNGGRGNDLLIGGAGDDDLYGEAGSDTFRGGPGADLFNGGGGEDLVEYQAASTGVQVALDGSLAGTGEAAGDTFTGIERLRGSNFADTLRGDANANGLIGEGGADVLQGMAGNDMLRGNIGADILTGGANADTFQYMAITDGGDTITDFSAVDDRFQFVGSGFGGLPAGALAANRFQSGIDPSVLTAGGNVRFYYETDTRTLWFDADGVNGGAIAIATLQTGASMTVADIFIA